MSIKQKSVYVCQNCSFETSNWVGQCPECGTWNSFVESVVSAKSIIGTKGFGISRRGLLSTNIMAPVQLSKVSSDTYTRISSNISEFDHVLGGGFVPGQVVLIAGDPGIGKSTLLTQIAKELKNKKVLYICGEESPGQIKIRAERMGYKAENLFVLSENDADVISESLNEKKDYALVIVDSIQTLTTQQLTGVSGSVGQVKACAQILTDCAKRTNVPLILIGHVTKEGTVAGPKVLEHLVDTVLYLEGDSQHLYRILKTTKNRFGPISEVGVFEMNEKGMEQVTNPSKLFLNERLEKASGSCVTVVMEGFRPILFEIQALVSRTAFGYPKRTASGFNANRLSVLIATLEKRCSLNLSTFDVYVNVAGGFKISDYACDLAVCLAIASSLKDKTVGAKTAVFGECGLLGEIRKVSHAVQREKEAKKMGFTNIISPENTRTLKEAVAKLWS